MAKMKPFDKRTYRLGYNTRDNPKTIPFDSCQVLENMYPRDPNPLPREGVVRWNSESLPSGDNVREIIEWSDDTSPRLLVVKGDDLYWIDDSLSPATQIGSGGEFTGATKIKWIRNRGQLFIVTNKPSYPHAYIIEWNGVDDFTIRNSNIAQVTLNLAVTRTGTGNISESTFVSYGVSIVRRTDAASIDGGGDPQLVELASGGAFHPGDLEMIEDLGERVVFNDATSGGSQNRIGVDNPLPAIDPQATHLRFYRTAEFQTDIEAQGGTHRWLVDVPITGPNAPSDFTDCYTDNLSNGVISGSLNESLTVGLDPIPRASAIEYHLGKMWIGGEDSGEGTGRWYHSTTPFDIQYPLKWFTMFDLDAFFKDTSLDDTEFGTAIGKSGNDIIFLNRRQVWYLPDGDSSFEPRLISQTAGTDFANSLTAIDGDLYYLSREGPAVVSRRQVILLESHTAGEVWPRIHDQSAGYFFTLTDKLSVRSAYFRDTWFLSDGNEVIGFTSAADGKGVGPWKCIFGDSSISASLIRVVNSDLCLICSNNDPQPRVHSFLVQNIPVDIGGTQAFEFTLRSKSKAIYYSPDDRTMFGEVFELLLFFYFTDTNPLNVRLISDYFRYNMLFPFNAFPETQQLQAPGAAKSFSHIIQQVIPEGFIGTFFEVEWEKVFGSPYNFNCEGFRMEMVERENIPIEFSSQDFGNGTLEITTDILFYAEFDEDSDTLKDLSPYARDHSWSPGDFGSRTSDPALIPMGGQSLAGSPGSGYTDSNWTGLEFIGDNSDGTNSEELTWEFVFEDLNLSSDINVWTPGDGTQFWRFKILMDGTLEFAISTTDDMDAVSLNSRFYTAAGVVSAGQDIVLQFTLTNGGLNGAFFVGERLGVMQTPLTMKESL